MENKNGKGIFYGVIGVATLIVAIIGATFAYFTATTASGQYLTGTAATASLEVKVQRLTGYSAGEGAESAAAAKYVMVPQLDKGLSQAVRGSNVTENTPCIDANGSLVCSIYKILVHSIKSDAKYLGFKDLAEKSYEHEMKSKENDIELAPIWL